MTSELFQDYAASRCFDEALADDGETRAHYEALFRDLAELRNGEMSRRESLRDAIFRRLDITFAVYGNDEGVDRIWPMDLVPRIIPSALWDEMERGLVQRVQTLNTFLNDLYTGERAAIRDGIIPNWLVQSSEGFNREAFGIEVPHGARCVVSGCDLVRDADGVFRCLEDNLRTPSGVSYVLENRAAMMRVLPGVFAKHRVRPVNQYSSSLLEALKSMAPPGAASSVPRVVVLTPGIYNSAYFEHAYLARQMGAELVEGRDLVVDDFVVYMRTTRGLERVDVIYSRVNEDFLDPAVFRPDSALGAPGLMSAVRAGNLTIANAIGNGVADDKAVYPYVPALTEYYLGEKPILENVTTYMLWEPESRRAVLDRIDELVVKPVAASGGYGIVIGPHATKAELDDCRKRIERNPRNYIAQELVELSAMPTYLDGRMQPRHLDLRPFVVCGERTEVLPGGLTRVALREGSYVVNSSQGGGSKDTWVLADESGA